MGTPNYPKDLSSEWNKLRRDVKSAFTSANLRTGMAKIGAKVIEITGQLELNPSAILAVKYANSVNALWIGPVTYNGHDVGQFIVRRYDGSTALQVFGGPLEAGFFSINDKAGNIIMSDDAGSGQGLGRPWLPYNVIDTRDIALPQMITSSTFTAVYTVSGYMQQPKCEVYGWLRTDGSDVAEIRVRNPNTGTVLYTSAGNTGNWKSMLFNHENYNFGDAFRYDVEIRRSSGTSTGVGFALTRATGQQT